MIQLVVCGHFASTLKALTNYEKEEKRLVKAGSRELHIFPQLLKSPKLDKVRSMRSEANGAHLITGLQSLPLQEPELLLLGEEGA